MLGVGGLPPPSSPPLLLKRASSNHHFCLSVFPQSLSNRSPLYQGRTGFCLFAQKNGQSSRFGSIEVEKKEEGFEEGEWFEIDDDDDDDEDDFFSDDDEEDDNDDVIFAFGEMDDLLKRKPRGFGEGKVYDTSIEDKLLEEIEQSRKAQIDNLNRLKNGVKQLKPKNELKASEGVPNGIRVRLSNLPKKKNIDRDLKSAFGGVSGIIKISPAVSGNKKTREPVCKGFAFVEFKSLEDANRFVQMFSGQNIGFGKIKKQIKFEILKSSDAGEESPSYEYNTSSESTLSGDDEYGESDKGLDDGAVVESCELLSLLERSDSDGSESEREMKTDPDSLVSNKEKTKAVRKKSAVKKKQDKAPKLSIPGSAMKLKVREKAKLADVFSRYGTKQALASKEM